MNRNYRTPTVSKEWADNRETHLAVATAIHAIADSTRSPESIWMDPTPAEWDHVEMAVCEYLNCGDFDVSLDGRYEWGLRNDRSYPKRWSPSSASEKP